jgi:hypothetical protein
MLYTHIVFNTIHTIGKIPNAAPIKVAFKARPTGILQTAMARITAEAVPNSAAQCPGDLLTASI